MAIPLPPKAQLWDPRQLSKLFSLSPAVRSAAEAHFATLPPEAVSAVIARIQATKRNWLIASGICLGIQLCLIAASLWFRKPGYHYFDPANSACVAINVCILLGTIYRMGLWERALTQLQGDVALNEILMFLREHGSNRGPIAQSALAKVSLRIERDEGNLPALTPQARFYIHFRAMECYRVLDPGVGEITFREAVLKWRDNLFDAGPAEKLYLLSLGA